MLEMPFLLVSLHLSLLFCLLPLSCAQLNPSFYGASCPSAVSTVTNTILSLAKKDNVVAPSTLRLILHDCFVEGCDGSILVSSTSGNKAERDADDNANLPQNAFNAIAAAKKAVEQVCPGVVSCADILALAARDSVVFLGGPSWEVPLGRLDGRVSTAASVEGRLPGANFNIKQLTDNFGSLGLTLQDMVILSGAHTIGFSHCDQFKNRLYSFNSSVTVDPSLDTGFAQKLKARCPASGADNLQPFDILSPFSFDNNYFKDLQSGKGLLFSDQVLFQDASTRSIVESMAASQDAFFESFTQSMIKMTSIGVKQGAQGEVRKVCTAINAGGANVQQPSPAGGSSVPAPPLLSPSQPAPILGKPPAAPLLPAQGSPPAAPASPPPAGNLPAAPLFSSPASPPAAPVSIPPGTPPAAPLFPSPASPSPPAAPVSPPPGTPPAAPLFPPPASSPAAPRLPFLGSPPAAPLSPPLGTPPAPPVLSAPDIPPAAPVLPPPLARPPLETAPVILPPSPPSPVLLPVSPPSPQVMPPPSPALLPVSPPPLPPSPSMVSLPPPSPPPSPVTISLPPPPPQADAVPAPVPPAPGGITIPGIPGFTPPIHIQFPGIGGGPSPPSSGSRSKSSAENSRGRTSRKGV